MRYFAKNISEGKITLNNDDEDQTNLLIKIVELKKNRLRDFT